MTALHLVPDIPTPTPKPHPDSGSPRCRQAWALLAYDPSTGCATAVVAIAGVDEHGSTAVTWLPLVCGADSTWRNRLRSVGAEQGPLLRGHINDVNGITTGAEELDVPPADDIAGAVEQLMDEYLADAA